MEPGTNGEFGGGRLGEFGGGGCHGGSGNEVYQMNLCCRRGTWWTQHIRRTWGDDRDSEVHTCRGFELTPVVDEWVGELVDIIVQGQQQQIYRPCRSPPPVPTLPLLFLLLVLLRYESNPSIAYHTTIPSHSAPTGYLSIFVFHLGRPT